MDYQQLMDAPTRAELQSKLDNLQDAHDILKAYADWAKVKLQSQREALKLTREALEAVEWVHDDYQDFCPWCRAIKPEDDWRIPPPGHKPDCPRQRALAALKDVA